MEVANACNRYPSIEVEFEVMNSAEEILSDESVAIKVILEREDEDYSELVSAPYFPKVLTISIPFILLNLGLL